VIPQANRFQFSRSSTFAGLAVLGLVLGVAYLIVSSQATHLDRPVDPVAGAERPWVEATANNNMSGARDAIIGTLQHWIQALQARDIDTHMTHYSNRLHTYYLKHGVSRSEVRRDRERAIAGYVSMKEDLKNIEIDLDPSGTNAIATFDKSWNFEGRYPSSGLVQERVWLHNVDGNWLITGERDLKLYSRTDTLKWP
jgi:ketosteroid isomerase-like protein